MTAGTKAKGGSLAIFSADGRALFSHGLRKVRKQALQDRPGKAPRLTDLWSVGVAHSSSLTLTPDQTRLLVTDTSGGLHALDAATGAPLWRNKPLGESNRGLILPDGSYLQVTWSGLAVRINPETGAVLSRRPPTDRMMTEVVHVAGSTRIIYQGVSHFGTDGTVETAVRRLDLDEGISQAMRPVRHRIMLATSPDGTLLASREAFASSDGKTFLTDARIEETASGRILSQRTYPFGAQHERALCWPDPRFVCHGDREGFWFLDPRDLSPLAHVPLAYPAHATVSLDGSLVFLSGWEGSLLLRVADLSEFPPPVG